MIKVEIATEQERRLPGFTEQVCLYCQRQGKEQPAARYIYESNKGRMLNIQSSLRVGLLVGTVDNITGVVDGYSARLKSFLELLPRHFSQSGGKAPGAYLAFTKRPRRDPPNPQLTEYCHEQRTGEVVLINVQGIA